MNAGQLDRRITIQALAASQDAVFGTQVSAWTDFAARIPAQVLDALPSKSEAVTNSVQIGTSRARLRIRYLSGVTSAMRVIVHGSADRTYQIVGGPSEIGRREGLEMMIEEYTS